MPDTPPRHADQADPRFLTAPLSAVLDLARIVSATVVVLGHAFQFELLGGRAWVAMFAQHYAVIVFFVISGLSIGTSIRKPAMDLAQFARDRAWRILPVSLFALLLGAGLFAWRHGQGAVTYDSPDLALTLPSLLWPALFLTESPFGTLPVWNPVFWSLSYEVWYYALFAAAWFLHGRRRLLVVVALATIAGPQILLLMPIWLCGAGLAGWTPLRRLGVKGGLIALALSALLVWVAFTYDLALLTWLAARSPFPLVNSQNLLGDSAFGLAVALCLVGLRPLLGPLAGPLQRAAPLLRRGAGMTFTTYLVHVPLICLLESFGVKHLTDPGAIAAVLAAIFLACALLADLVERRTQTWRSAEARWPARRSGPVRPVSV